MTYLRRNSEAVAMERGAVLLEGSYMLFYAEAVAGGSIKCEGVREVSAYLIAVLSTVLLC